MKILKPKSGHGGDTIDMCDKYGYTIDVIGTDTLLVKNDKSI